MGGSGGVEQGEADYFGAIGRRIYVQLLFSCNISAHLHMLFIIVLVVL